jgi:WD40 repeat protein
MVALIGGLAISTWLFVRTEAARGEAERNLYAARMNLAQAAWEQANIDRLRQILEETRTYPDRGFEWFYWQRQLHLELRTLHGHTSRVRSVAFSPDGRRILTGSNDRTARTWDAETGRELVTFTGHRSAIDSVAFSPDGTRILMCGGDETARLCDAETGRKPPNV